MTLLNPSNDIHHLFGRAHNRTQFHPIQALWEKNYLGTKIMSTPHYSPSIQSGDLIFTSGQLPLLDRVTKKTPDGIMAQTRLVLDKVENILREYGLTKRNIVKTTAFITDIESWEEVNEIYAEFFGDYKPARSIIPVSDLHFGCLIELEAIASTSIRD